MSFNQNRQGSSWLMALWTAGADKRIKQIQNIRDDGTSADEILAIGRKALYLSLVFSTLFCFIFYFQYLSEGYPIWVAIVGAVIVASLIELGKIFFGIRTLRYLYFGRPLHTIADTILFFGLTAIAVLAFYWSVTNSTSGLHDLTELTVRSKSYKQISFSPDVAGIDRQIADARASQERAANMTWRGKQTVESQRLSRRAEENIKSLQQQRLLMIGQAQKQYDTSAKMAENKTEKAATWTRLIGGMIEAVQILLLIICASCEKKLADRHFPSPTTNGSKEQNGQYFSQNGQAIGQQNGATTSPFQNVSVRPTQSLSDNGARASVDEADDYILLRLKRLRGFDDLFKNSRNRPQTVAGQMWSLLNEIGKKMQASAVKPETAATLLEYLTETGFPVLEANGFEYKYKEGLLDLCHKALPANAA